MNDILTVFTKIIHKTKKKKKKNPKISLKKRKQIKWKKLENIFQWVLKENNTKKKTSYKNKYFGGPPDAANITAATQSIEDKWLKKF